jgi:hypothetical protein
VDIKGDTTVLQIAEPIIGIELDSKDVNVFWKMPEAEMYVEPADIDNWLFFDSIGRELRITPNLDGQRIDIVATQKIDKSTLRIFIEAYLRQPDLANDTRINFLRKLTRELPGQIQ